MTDTFNVNMKRRAFLSGAATLAATGAMAQTPPAGPGGPGGPGGGGGGGRQPQRLAPATTPPQVPSAGRPQANDKFGPSVDTVKIIDAHIHLFDGNRSGGGYMGSAAYKAASSVNTPERYAPMARAAGISGAIIVESAGGVEDNQWYLDEVNGNDIMVGVSGRLDPYSADFAKNLERFHKDPLYRAIRASRFYTTDRATGKVTLDQVAVDNLKLLAQADLAQDTANPSMPLMQANVMLADAIPNARIIMDHLPSFDPTPDNQKAYEDVVQEMAKRPNIFVKLTEVYHPRLVDGSVVDDYTFLADRLEYLYHLFGEDRVMFGTDYPNSYGVATMSEEVGLMKKFFSKKTKAQAEKYFWRNAAHIYKYVKRTPDQPSL
jgi:predicted TIM-barrel fold metal-dependent hydrolase